MSKLPKKPQRRTMLQGALALGAVPMIMTEARAQSTVKWRVQSHWPKASSSFDDSLVPLAKELEERTGGRFKLELLGAGEVAKGAEIFNMVNRGVIPMGTTAPAYNSQESELLNMYMGIPGSLQEPWQMAYVTKIMGLEAAVNEDLKSKGRNVFYMAEKAYPTELVLKKELKAGDDTGRIKIRSAGALIDYFHAAGFVPQNIDGPELYQALATGVIDGAHWGGAQGALSMKLWEVAKYHMMPSVLMANDVFIISTKAWDKLPDDLREIFRALLDSWYYRRTTEYQYKEMQALRKGVDDFGVKVEQYPEDVQKDFSKATEQILAKEMGKGPKAQEMGEKLQEFMQAVKVG